MRMFILICLFAISSSSMAGEGKLPPPPAVVTQQTYVSWLEDLGSTVSPFTGQIFSWFETQKNTALPDPVGRDPEKLFVTVEVPLQETIELEENGDIESGVTYGFEAYAIIDAPIQVALEAMMYKWGKPLGQSQGITHPNDTVYGYRQEELFEQWGLGNYLTKSTRTNGGIAKDQHDSYTLLVRGNELDGYVMVGNFFRSFGNTTTTSSINIVTFRPLADGKTEYRVSSRHLGQSYKFFGIEFGRKNYGFNRDRVRAGVKEYLSAVDELKRTGKIKERN